MQVEHAAMVDIAVRSLAIPELGIQPEVVGHILVDKLLEINAEGAVAPHHEIGAYALVGGDIATRVGEKF